MFLFKIINNLCSKIPCVRKRYALCTDHYSPRKGTPRIPYLANTRKQQIFLALEIALLRTFLQLEKLAY